MRRLWSSRAHSLAFPLILSACVWISPSPSLGSRCCASLPAAKSSALFRCLALSQEEEGGDGGDGGSRGGGVLSLGDPVFTSLFYSAFYKSALFVHTQKCLSFLLFAVVFTRRRVFSVGAISFFVFFFFSFLPSASSRPLHLRETLRGFGPPPPHSLLSLDRGGRLGCLVMAT